jgi:cold shock CspA family protein
MSEAPDEAVHWNDLSEGQRVAMEVTEGRKGLEAVTVSLRD